jgi:predicted ATPase/class 3 adenylate cyclase
MSLLNCDLVDSSILARSLDPEDLRYAITNFHKIANEVIKQYEGYYAQYMGDGFMAYFSYPIAHEDDAYRAVLAGLRIVEEVGRFNADLKERYNIELRVRVGVDTGEVVVDEFVVGEPPTIANRVQTAAAPNTVAITETTRRLLPPNAFAYEDLGVHELKNVGSRRLFRVVERQDRDTSAVPAQTTRPLIGRRKQLDLLADSWELVKEGIGQAVILAGDPGIGKSKLVQGFELEFGSEVRTNIKLHGSPFHTNTMLHPVIENIQIAAGILPADNEDEKLGKLGDFLKQFDNAQKMLPLMARLLSISEASSFSTMAPQKVLQQTIDVLLEMSVQYANRGPTLLIFEDIHWFDSTTMHLLEELIPLMRNQRCLLLLTTRSSSTPQLQEKYHLTQITLPRLRSNEVETLIQAVTEGHSLPQNVRSQILNKANGVPLYVEELTKMVLEELTKIVSDEEVVQGGTADDLIEELDLTIPLTLRDPLTSRVDRVRGRRVLQLAATLGRNFSYQLLLAVSSLDSEVLNGELRHLVDAELLYQKGATLREATFEFKHLLIRDAAYALLTKAERETYHTRAATLLEDRFSEMAEAHPEIVAYHYTQSRVYHKAVHYWYEAARRSAARSAHNEAVGHLRQGLKLIPNVEDGAVRNKSELLLQTALGNAMRSTKGWSIETARNAYTRAYQLCQESGFDGHTFPVVFGLWSWNFVHAALDEARSLAEHLLHTAENAADVNYEALAREALGFTLFARGQFAAAHSELQRSIAMCEDSRVTAYLELSAQDPRVHARSYESLVLWFLGYPDQALRMCAEARAYADESQNPFSEAMAQTISLRVHQFRGDVDTLAAHASAAIALCAEHDFVHYLAMGLILRGWATAQNGDFEAGVAEIQQGLDKQRASGALLYEPYALALLADVCIKNEHYRQALGFLQQAQSTVDGENCEHFYAAEIYRLLGEAYLRSQRDVQRAERCFQKGLKIARDQQAKSLELKLCLSMLDLYEPRSTTETFRPQLGMVYGSFSEGFDTRDLVSARMRLEMPE